MQGKEMSNPTSLVEADSSLATIIPGSRPDLVLIKQVDQAQSAQCRVVSPQPVSGVSPHCRHDVFGAGADAGGPAGGYGFEAGVEAHAFHAVHRHVAEQGALPATETVEGHRHRDRHVDA